MALPIVGSLKDCCSFEQTVTRYISQLYEFPSHVINTWHSPASLGNLYLATNPFIGGLIFSLFVAFALYLVSEVNGNVSLIDQSWSILPSIYNIHYVTYARLSGLNTKRLEVLVFVSVIWSIRLTYNFYRKGGYSKGSDDYRWDILRKMISPSLFVVFNIIFISLIQSLLLFLITAPTYLMLLVTPFTESITVADYVFASVLLALIVYEYIADQQQWHYQVAKKIYNETARVTREYTQQDLERGFVVTGLWSKSRHPNFLAEQAIWVVFYVWGSWTSHKYINWSSVGVISYLILFQGSTSFTEKITAAKYREYKEYQKSVRKFIPNFSSTYYGHALKEKDP
ncbi:putative duf1295 domain protein [Erysiphe necator]|uniref:Putative duf1295 domain protein n=1 Tax=Uncinula necator TaxID=52586 RepID=A0A0B1P612_UNCNE|nr:putative duf1295 domain protein [Erysiphe necator]